MKNALVVPGVFFLSFLSALAVFAFFGGLAECYGLTLPPSELAGFLMLCIVRSACYTLPIAAVFAIIGVYAFLLRHRAKLSVAVSLFLLCLVFTAIVIIPAFYAQASSVETALAAFTAYAPADTAVTGFIDQPFFLTPFIQSADVLFNDLYSAYRSSFAIYLRRNRIGSVYRLCACRHGGNGLYRSTLLFYLCIIPVYEFIPDCLYRDTLEYAQPPSIIHPCRRIFIVISVYAARRLSIGAIQRPFEFQRYPVRDTDRALYRRADTVYYKRLKKPRKTFKGKKENRVNA